MKSKTVKIPVSSYAGANLQGTKTEIVNGCYIIPRHSLFANNIFGDLNESFDQYVDTCIEGLFPIVGNPAADDVIYQRRTAFKQGISFAKTEIEKLNS